MNEAEVKAHALYNELVTEIKKAVGEIPLSNGKGKFQNKVSDELLERIAAMSVIIVFSKLLEKDFMLPK